MIKIKLTPLLGLILLTCANALGQQASSAGAFAMRMVGEPAEVQAHPERFEKLRLRDEEIWVSKEVELDGTMLVGATSKIRPKLADEEIQKAATQLAKIGQKAQIEQLKKNNTNKYWVNIQFNSIGAEKFVKLTGKTNSVGRRLAIFLDGKILSAPEILEPFVNGNEVKISVKSEEEMNLFAARVREIAKESKT